MTENIDSANINIIELFTHTKWDLLKNIAEKKQSPTEIANKLGTSVSNVLQQLKILEAHGIIKKEKTLGEKNIGKPKNTYSINKEIMYGVVLRNGKAEQKIFPVNNNNSVLINIAFLAGMDDSIFLIRFMIKYEDILKKCKAIGYIRSNKDSIELFLVTSHVDELRATFSNIFMQDAYGVTKKIINWTHNEIEIHDGLHRKDTYFVDMIKTVEPLHDPENIFVHAKKLL